MLSGAGRLRLPENSVEITAGNPKIYHLAPVLRSGRESTKRKMT